MTYAELLAVFWENHDPATAPSCRQYRSAIFYRDEAQRLEAEATWLEQQAVLGTLHTEIAPVPVFHLAEYYHQKWYLQNHGLLKRDLEAIYPDPRDFIDSTVSARVNGVVGRHYTAERLEAEIASFGLSEESNALLRSLVQD